MNNYIIFRTYKYTNMDEITGNGLKWIEQKKDTSKDVKSFKMFKSHGNKRLKLLYYIY